MKVKIQIEFEGTADLDEDEHGSLTKERAVGAASEAAYQNLCLTNNGIGVVESVSVHVDGFGECEVKVGEEHE